MWVIYPNDTIPLTSFLGEIIYCPMGRDSNELVGIFIPFALTYLTMLLYCMYLVKSQINKFVGNMMYRFDRVLTLFLGKVSDKYYSFLSYPRVVQM